MLYVRVRGIKVIHLQCKNHFAVVLSREVREQIKIIRQTAGEKAID